MKWKVLIITLVTAFSFVAAPLETSALTRSYDVVVYGATPSGVTAAIEARRQGKTVALVEPTSFIGGMVTSGLSHTDVGNKTVIGGIAKEYFGRIASVYGAGEGYDFEPKVGTQVMNQMLSEAGVPIFTGEQLVEGPASITKTGTTITSITTTIGDTFAGKVFIDASYEGDLMADAGVSYTTGRESSAQYGESAAGVQAYNNDFTPTVSAYDASGNLYPGVSATPLNAVGAADDHVQAYNFRFTSTNVAAKRVPYPKPLNYNANDYALLAQWMPSYQASLGRDLVANDLVAFVPIPNGKFDTNARGPFTTDFLNASFGYSNGSYADRQTIYQQTKDYDQGLMYFLQNDPSVLPSVHADMANYGLPSDEFTTTGNWPPQLYVREARRMIGQYVVTQKDLQTTNSKTDSIALGSYRMDEHPSYRGVGSTGNAQNEGTFSITTAGWYQLPYRMITPQVSQVTNLLVTGALSTTHVAWSGIRMEPQFMMLGQAAADAASMAIDSNIAVQNISIPNLQTLLIRKGMLLTFNQKTNIVVDSSDPSGVSLTGAWLPSTATAGYYGADYLHDNNGTDTKTVKWTPDIPTTGVYTVSVRWTAHTNRTTAAKYVVTDSAGKQTTVTENQQTNGGTWVSLGTFTLKAGHSANVSLSTAGTTGFVVADAVQFSR
ncbi:MAG: hypothetical protein JWM81_1098 [Candidatus Saccharibacteria bacterium]|nr:hypothetical protein [Candidatus Saccharibacteria bacterium]